MTRRINKTTKVHAKRTKTGYTITMIEGINVGAKKFLKEATAIKLSPRSKFNLRHVARHLIKVGDL